MRPDRPVLLYDGECRFCRACARAIATLDRRRRLAILPFSHPLARRLLAPLPAQEREASIHIVTPAGRVLSGGRALIQLAASLPGGRALARAAQRRPAIRATAECAYRTVAGKRPLLSRLAPDVPAVIRAPELRNMSR